MNIQSAGFIIVDFSGTEPLVLCLLDHYHRWDFPKGHVEKKETLLQTAFRETKEECGLSSVDFKPSGVFASTLPYSVPRGKKISTYFFAERVTDTKPYLPTNPWLGKPEHIALQWFSVKELHSKMPKRLHTVVDELVKWISEVQD